MLVGLIGRLFSQFESVGVVQSVIVSLVYKIGVFGCVQEHYHQNYGKPTTIGAKRKLSRSLSSSDSDSFDPEWRPSPAQPRKSSYDHEKASPFRRLEFEWRQLPAVPVWIRNWHVFTTIWMSYVLFRYILMERIQNLLQLTNLTTMLDLKPAHCYLIGRFVLDKNFADLMGACLALMHISWRFSQLFARAKPVMVLYFLLLSQHDLDLIYKQFSNTNGSIQLTADQFDELSWCERFVYEIMCYRVAYRTKTLLKLRSNRSARAHQRLRRGFIRGLIFIMFGIIVPAGIVITPLAIYRILLDRRILDVYPECDPEFERLVRSKPFDANSISWPTPRRLLIISVDIIENLVVWLDSGISCACSPLIMCLMGYDLTLAWREIGSKIVSLESRLSRGGPSDQPAGQVAPRASVMRFPLRLGVVSCVRAKMIAPAGGADESQPNAQTVHKTRDRDEIYQLISEIYDFFEQIRKLDILMRQFVLAIALACIGFCAIFTYFSQTHALGRLPFEVLAIFGALLLGLIACCYGFLMVNHYCLASYSRFCSLMALDRWKSEHNFESIVELYTKKKSCFSLIGHYPFQGTTFLSLVGWTFSCFCLISGSLRRA